MNKENISSKKMYWKTLEFFTKILNDHQNDSDSIANILTKNAKTHEYIFVDDGKLIFSIEGLYHHLKYPSCLSYNQYRRMLYTSQLNLELKKRHLIIINYNNDLLIKANLYSILM